MASARHCKTLLCAIALTGLWLSPVALCADRHLSAYAAYTEAFQSGRLEAAIRHARAAWDAAEAELGDDPVTAVLAYNYARLAFAYAGHRDAARSAYQRVVQLNQSSPPAFRHDDLQIALAELDLLDAQDNAELQQRLRELLWERRRVAPPATDLSAHAWLTLATAELRLFDRNSAAKHADIAAAQAESLDPADVDLASSAYLLAATARLSDQRCVDHPEQVHAAIENLDRSIALLSPMPGANAAERLQMATQWRQSAQELSERMRRERSRAHAKYWPER